MSNARLLSLDVMRGFTIIGMIIVNCADMLSRSGIPVHTSLLHSAWAGLSYADIIFPLFIFMVGVSIPYSIGGRRLDLPLFGHILKRSILLVTIGILINLSFTGADADLRYFGVLQRIGLTYFFAALLYLTLTGAHIRHMIMVILLGYWGLCMMAVPDLGAGADGLHLFIPGANMSSWIDRSFFADHILMKSVAYPYDPEGLLGTLPSLAQALIGVQVGLWIRNVGVTRDTIKAFTISGISLFVLGLMWSIWFPLIKPIWSSSFVLVTSGIALLCLAGWAALLDLYKKRWIIPVISQGFGLNAITIYVLHIYIMTYVLRMPAVENAYEILTDVVGQEVASFLPILIVIFLCWVPVEIMRRQRWIIKI